MALVWKGRLRRSVVVCVLSACVPGAGVLFPSPMAVAQTAVTNSDIAGTWQGTLHMGKDFRTVIKIDKLSDGTLKAAMWLVDQGGNSIPMKTTTFAGGTLKIDIEAMGGNYEGKLSPDGTTITGTLTQGDRPNSLILLRATPETAWAIPAPPPKIPPMDPKADPNPEIATIKLTPPDAKGKNFGGAPRRFQTHNTSLSDLMMFAFDVQQKQILGGPAWMETEHYDLMLQPDLPGAPSEAQVRSMMRKLLADRFGLKFHKEQKEMAAYVLTVAKTGPKLTKSEAPPDSPHAFFFTQLGNLTFRNATMDDFAHGMQSAVFDRPVVNKTGVEGHFDGRLKWNPDETQFAVFGVKVVPSDAPDAPPPVYQAIQDQIGLKLDATKTQVDVMVLDHVEKPSEN